MTTIYAEAALEAKEKATARLLNLAHRAEHKGDLARAEELRRRAEVLRGETA
jgi:hypothetical protein